MASNARNAIIDSFIRLLEARPVNRISVKDIVEDCGINRNTFYYHFADIPALVDALLKAEAETLAHSVLQLASLEECVVIATRHCKAHRRAIGHLYRYASREVYERCLMEICEHLADVYVDSVLGNRAVPAEDRSAIAQGCKCELFGFITDWLRHDMSDDMERAFLRLCTLRGDVIESMFERSLSGR